MFHLNIFFARKHVVTFFVSIVWGDFIPLTQVPFPKANILLLSTLTLRYYVDLNILKQIYYALIYPYLSYGILAWGCASKTRLDCLRIKHNKCLRTIFFVHPRESAAPYFKLLTIPKLHNIYKLKIWCLIHRMRNEADSIPDTSLMSWLQHPM